MPRMSYEPDAAWTNYHMTRGVRAPDAERPVMMIKSLAAIDASDANHASGLERFAATATTLFGHLRDVEAQLAASGAPFAAGMTGSAWSFSALVGSPVSQLCCAGLSGTSWLDPAECHVDCKLPVDYIVLAGGGTTMKDIAEWTKAGSRTVMTSGSFLGTTIAGGFATASHGSRLGYGGIQNMVLGMHLIVGSGEHVWIERKSCRVLSQLGRERLAAAGVNFRFVADDDQFEDALIHLGAMGIVNGVALALTDNRKFALMQRRHSLARDWLDDIAKGDFKGVAERLECSAEPAFYELTLNPHAPFDDDATHTMYFPTTRTSLAPAGPAKITTPADAISGLGSHMLQFGIHPLADASEQALHLSMSPDPVPLWVMQGLFGGAESAFEYYRRLKPYQTLGAIFDPEDPSVPAYQWSELHEGEITSGIPGALYNASFAIELERVPDVIPLLSAAVADLPPAFVFTLRFVSKAAGTLAFTRFDQSAVIEIDGLSPLICQLTKAKVDLDHPQAGALVAALDKLSVTLQTGAAAIRKALDGVSIPYSMHWGKLGDLDQAKVYADYGHPSGDPRKTDSLIRRWRETREALLTDFGKKIFWNEAVVSYGLIDDVR